MVTAMEDTGDIPSGPLWRAIQPPKLCKFTGEESDCEADDFVREAEPSGQSVAVDFTPQAEAEDHAFHPSRETSGPLYRKSETRWYNYVHNGTNCKYKSKHNSYVSFRQYKHY